VVVARRGPFEAKFDKKEFDYIEEFLDRKAFDEELRRIQPQLSSIGQDISKLAEETFPVLATPAADHPEGKARLRFRFLCSPQAIHADANGRIDRLTVAENVLFERDGSIACKATDKSADLDVDTMIFAIGDVADPAVGLPYNAVGWARKASDGLVGIARHDAEVGAVHVLKYLETAPESSFGAAEVQKFLERKGLQVG
jgi:ferredoxin--NADP+ reductase